MSQKRSWSWFVGTLVILLVLFGVITYISWSTPIGTQTRYYYYAHAVVALGIVLAVVTFIITDGQRRRADEKAALQRTLRINQRYWVNLERFFAQHAPALNRLYKQMWPDAADVQALPDIPATPCSSMQEVHAANMLFGIISNMNAEIALDKPPDQVVAAWQQPQYLSWYGTLKNWLQSDIVCKRWVSSRHLYTPEMQTLVDSLTGGVAAY